MAYRSKAQPFTVFVCDKSSQQTAASTVRTTLDRLWPEETANMGAPVLPGPLSPEQGRIPVYIVSNVDIVCQQDFSPNICLPALGGSFGEALPLDRNGFADTSSAVILIHESRGDTATVAHELFHALEFARSLTAAASWLGEASAAWAEHVYVPGGSPHRGAVFDAFQQASNTSSLNDSTSSAHEEGAMVWLDYLEEVQGEAAVFSLWTTTMPANGGVPSTSAVDGRLDGVAPWSSNFPAFAVEDLNLDLPGLGNLNRHFADAGDPAVLVGVTPQVAGNTLISDSPVSTTVALRALQANYDHVTVGPDVRDVKLDFSSVQPGSNADVTVLANVGGTWSAQSPGADGTLEFCKDNAAQDVSEFYVVVDNHAFQSGQSVSGTYTATGKQSCSKWPRQVTGTVMATSHLMGNAGLVGTLTLSVSFTISASSPRSVVCPEPGTTPPSCFMLTPFKFGNTMSGTFSVDLPAGFGSQGQPACNVTIPVTDANGEGYALVNLIDDPRATSQLAVGFADNPFDCTGGISFGPGFVFPFSAGSSGAQPTLDPRSSSPGDTGTASLQFTY